MDDVVGVYVHIRNVFVIVWQLWMRRETSEANSYQRTVESGEKTRKLRVTRIDELLVFPVDSLHDNDLETTWCIERINRNVDREWVDYSTTRYI